ncbi:MAG: replicative DNA helicase [Candidatus Gracilibacteria bacterium]|nr:replicative DNA helicase [Candidatus Gracilibacteria bacterium]MDD2908225.1 replicative DNA helicase [Candidatus Gracilibacteria bacterium]
MVSKIPPSSIDAERGVLGSILIDKDGILQIASLIESDDFYDPNHGLVFRAMLDLFAKNKPIDLLTVREVLDDRQQLDKIGGNLFLVELTNAVFSSANIYQYANIVKNKSVLRKLIKSGNEIALCGYDEESELNKLLEKSEQSLFNVTQTFIQNKLVHIKDILNLRYEEFAEIHANPEAAELTRIKTGFKNLDQKMGGLRRGDMIIIAARPSMGKTALALNIAQNVGDHGRNVAVFSLEMSKEQLTDRLICSAMGVDSYKLQKGLLEDEEFMKMGDALERLSKAQIFIDDSAGGNLLEIKSKARRLKIESGLDVIVIDYLQLMSSGNSANRVQEVSEISRGIKSLARELNVPVIALSQLSRSVEGRTSKEPILSDLRESGSIEQDADIVMMMYREDYYDEFAENKGITSIFVRKNRNGPVGQVDLRFEKKFMRFYDVANDTEIFN